MARRRMLLAAVATAGSLLIVSLAAVGSASASPARGYPAPTAGPAIADNCALPLGQRTGNWYCPDVTTPAQAASVARAAQQRLGRGAVSNSDVVSVASATSCSVSGCWTIIDNYRTAFSGGGPYGYGSTPLGTITTYFKVTATGTKLTVYPTYFKSTRGMRDPEISEESMYTSAAYPQGHIQTTRQHNTFTWYGIQGANIEASWPSPGPSWYQVVQSPTVLHYLFWNDPSSAYPGTWYVYAKSYKFSRSTSGQYYVQASLPNDPSGGGWY